MTVEVAERNDTPFGQAFHANLRNVFAGAICSVLTLAYCLSYAALIFAGPLKQWLSYGVAISFLSAAVAAAVVALRSSLPFAIAGPDTSTSAVTATLAAVMVQHLLDHGVTSLLEPTLIVLALSTALTGALLCVLGFTNAGRAIRFVPYPVIGGFLGATGWLMILGAIQVVTDQRMTLEGFEAFASGPIAAKLAAGVAVALVLRFLMPLSHNPFMMPGILLAAIVVMYVALPLTGDSLADAQARGWTFQPQHLAALSLPLTPDTVRAFPWAALRHCPATCWRSCS